MRQFGQLEALVMDRLWDADESLTVREVLESLPDDRSRAYTTVMTVLDNLHRKGFADRSLEGKAYHYRARETREQHTAMVMEELLTTGGDRGATLLHFVEQMGPVEARRLRAKLEQLASEDDQP